MKKVLILGFSGSGKSTFARQLGNAINIPVIHLDTVYWKPGWVASNKQEWDKVITMLLEQEEYIIDGNYPTSLNRRLLEADTVFYFDLSIFLCLYRVLKRRLSTQGETAIDRAGGCSEPINLLFFVKWIWNFRKRYRNFKQKKAGIIKV
ncbi:AAA family ATPase [Paenibacillus psychroresistens]|uniref:AAA family ATPase n=1 Tax=Paenibacillus psychroresistens TaxID=1778678 RepID=A0A6B8RP64_9BACL|nr:AAA family ATPase [Paenibacillus psychroresistens]QGQ97293.1 AAA family ATPase [Paenibacillus psychroresistens]